MKFINFLILSGFVVLLVSNGICQQPKISIQKQSLQINIEPENHLTIIENTLSLLSDQETKTISFLINKNAAISKIIWQNKNLKYQLVPEFDLKKYLSESDSAVYQEYQQAGEVTLAFEKPFLSGQITICYSLTASDSVDQAAFSREYAAYEVSGFIGKKGIFISPSYFWYPTIPDDLSRFNISVTSPESLLVLTQGDLLKNSIADGQRKTEWRIDYPASGLHLVGSYYLVAEKKYQQVSIYTYFFPESQELAESYLTACQRYLQMYENLIGSYPFSKFAVVEHFFPTGYGMPSYTLLGSQVIRLPFIIYTSLGHEITHNWWGNSVYVDYQTGNWCEGLTTYYADHYYKENRSPEEARDYRRDLNHDFTVYVKENNDFPLSNFKERTESSSRAIGYGKSAMVFHQLKKIIGDSLFFKTFQKFYRDFKFKEASWADIKFTSEQVSQKNLDWFFDQWIQRKGAPVIELSAVSRQNNILSFTLEQTQPDIYRLFIPIEVKLANDSVYVTQLWLEESQQNFSLTLNSQPLQLTIDPNFDIFRKLNKAEIPPSFSEIFAQDDAWIVLPDQAEAGKLEAYQQMAQLMIDGEEQLSIHQTKEVSPADLKNRSFYLMGNPQENSLYQMISLESEQEFSLQSQQIVLNGKLSPEPDEVAICVTRRPDSEQNVCLIMIGENKKTGRVGSLLSHYGKYSYLIFSNGKNIMKGNYSVTKSPLSYSF
jgi:aminopeptidase N